MQKPINNIGTEPKKAHEYQVSGYYGQRNSITIEADTLLGMEQGFIGQLREVQELLSALYSANGTKTTREVLESWK